MKSNRFFFCLAIILFLANESKLLIAGDNLLEITGIVFEDINKNLKLDKGEKGIANVLVSDQHVVVKTDKKGRYKLSVNSEEAIINIIKPAGYALPLNELNLPQFYYTIDNEGKLPEEINFPLYKTSVTDSFKVLMIADPQTRTKDEVDYLRDDIVAELIGTDASFGIVLGDLMFDNLDLFSNYNNTMAQIGIPLYNVAGNHDFDHHKDTVWRNLETFRLYFGPEYYSFEYGKVSFIVLNSVVWDDDKKDASYRAYRGKIDEQQLNWLENYLQFIPDDRLIVLCTHVPFYSLNFDSQQSYILNRKQVYELIKNHKHLLAITGHIHALENTYLNEEMDWNIETPFQHIACAAASGSWWQGVTDERGIPSALQLIDGTPNGYHIFTFYGNKYMQHYKAAGKDPNYQVCISSPRGTIDKYNLDSVIIAANFFNGNNLSELTCQIDDSTPVKMERTIMKDPFAEQYFVKNRRFYYKWADVWLSGHIWTVKLPSDLNSALHKIVVIVKDEYGGEYKQVGIFEIID